MELVVLNQAGEDTGKKVALNDSIYAIEPNDHAIYLDVKQYLANQRQGTHKSKERGEISGSTRKLKKQKGTGTARAGSIKSPLFRGGGRAFGPRVRDYSFKLNKKLKQLARVSALSYKVKEQALTIVENFNLETPKTKEFIKIIDGLKVNARKVLFVLPENMSNIYLSSRNIENVKVITVNELSTYDVVNSTSLIFIDGVQDILQGQYGNN